MPQPMTCSKALLASSKLGNVTPQPTDQCQSQMGQLRWDLKKIRHFFHNFVHLNDNIYIIYRWSEWDLGQFSHSDSLRPDFRWGYCFNLTLNEWELAGLRANHSSLNQWLWSFPWNSRVFPRQNAKIHPLAPLGTGLTNSCFAAL